MNIKYTVILFFIFSSFQILSQKVDLTYYLPDINYDQNITTPEEFLGHQVGEWHVSHDKLYYYMKQIAAESDRVTFQEIGRTHENRPLVNLIFTSPSNHNQLEEIRVNHKNLTDPQHSDQINIDNTPIVIYQGYSIHGNESSGSNASLLNVYYLAAGQSDHITELLENSVIIVDPSYNPDGLHRFSTWANSHKGKNITADPNHREYRETWPRGRTNHYWFDLNRDWLLLTHPESRARVKVFHDWKPDILTDHHEMGTNSTFFFQPGIPQRSNPNTPARTQELTFEIGKYHAKALDKIGSLYYTKESFDDFYYGKGSTYPDINGGIGILFEQASSRGHAQESKHGVLTFAFTIRNQVATSISTQDAGLALRKDILSAKRKFFKDAISEGRKSSTKAYVFGNKIDQKRTDRFIEILKSHQIRVHNIAKEVKIGNKVFTPANSHIVPTDQSQYKLIKSIFEEVHTFKDSLFYDVSAWTLPHAFDLHFAELKSNPENYIGTSARKDFSSYIKIDRDPYAFLMEWSDYGAPAMLHKLLSKKLTIRVSHKDFTAQIGKRNTTFKKGTMIIPSENQPLSKEKLRQLMTSLSKKHEVHITEIATGFTADGFSLGSPSMSPLKRIRTAILVGEGVNGYDAGEAWHQMDQNMSIAVPLIDIARISNIDLDRYNNLVMVDGNYNQLDSESKKIHSWVKSGGNIIASKRAIDWLVSKGISTAKKVENPKNKSNPIGIYGNKSKDKGAKVTGGAIVNTRIDLTHPLYYGYDDPYLATFKKGNNYYQILEDPYGTPGRYTKKPMLSGYMHKNNIDKMSESAAVFINQVGKGKVIGIVDNPNFRGYWWGTSKLFANALFLGHIIN